MRRHTTTSLTVTTTTEPNPQASTPANTIRTIAAGLFGGLALGVVARAWMRFISDGPEFTWSGTIFILAAFGWSARTLLGFLAMIALYATIVRAGRATFAPPPSGLRLPR